MSDPYLNDLHERCQVWVVNISDPRERRVFFPPEIEMVMITYVIPIILFFGVPANLSFLIMMARFRQMSSTVNYYLTSLAIVDLLILIFAGTDKLARHYTASILLPTAITKTHCIFIDLIMSILFISSMFHITLVTLEIFYALCKPIDHRRISSKRRTFGLISLSWLLAFVFGFASNVPLPTFEFCLILKWPDGATFKKYPPFYVGCVDSYYYNTYNFIKTSVEFVAYLVALIFNCVLYFSIICKVRKNQIVTSQLNNRSNLKAVSKMIIVNGVAFFLCLTPWYIFKLVMCVKGMNHFLTYKNECFYWPSFVLILINTMINPFIYGTFNARYRAALKRVFSCKMGE